MIHVIWELGTPILTCSRMEIFMAKKGKVRSDTEKILNMNLLGSLVLSL